MAALPEQVGDGLAELLVQQREQEGVHERDDLQKLHALLPEPESAGLHAHLCFVEAEGLLDLPPSGVGKHRRQASCSLFTSSLISKYQGWQPFLPGRQMTRVNGQL